MPYANGHMRGNLYPTPLNQRCVSYDPCEICRGCTNFNTHSLDCILCESRKPVGAVCGHTDEQQHIIVLMNRKTKTPMSHPDKKMEEIGVPVAEMKDWDRIERELEASGLVKDQSWTE